MYKIFLVLGFVLFCSCGNGQSSKPSTLPRGGDTTPGFKLPEAYEGMPDDPVLQKSTNRIVNSNSTPKEKILQDKRFPTSRYLNLLPELDIEPAKMPHTSPRTRVITPNDFDSWEAAGVNDAGIDQLLMTPGDYTDWGPVIPKRSGSKSKSLIIRYYDPESNHPYSPEHPVRLKKLNKEVIVEGFKFDGISYWILHGLTFRGKMKIKRDLVGGISSSLFRSDNIVVDYCLFEDGLGRALRLYNASYNYIQNCVFRHTDSSFNGDGVAIGISATREKVSRSNKIINNEIINFSDGVGITRQYAKEGSGAEDQTGEGPGNVFENNDIYVTPEIYRYNESDTLACAENAFDFKTGTKSTLPEDRILIISNRLWGFRPADRSCGPSGSAGEAIIMQRMASNVLIKDNIIFDCNQGAFVKGTARKFPEEKVENIALVNNLFYKVGSYAKIGHHGTVFVLGRGIDAYYNTVIDATKLLWITGNRAENRFQCNTFIGMDSTTAYPTNRKSWSSMNAWYDYPDANQIYSHNGKENVFGKKASEAKLDDFVFYVKRWTGPERVLIPNAIPTTAKSGPKVGTEQGCSCGKGGEGNRWWNN